MPKAPLTARSPLAGLPVTSIAGRGVLASDRDGLGIASVLVRKERIGALTKRVRERFGVELPRGPHREAAGNVAFAATGPETWLATSQNGGNAFAQSLKETLDDFASVSDQSDGYAVLRLSGLKLRDSLTKFISIDLHPSVFKPGDVASTIASHITVTLWRLEDAPDGSPVFEIVLFRSLVGSFWQVLSDSTGKFGLLTWNDRSSSREGDAASL